MLCPPEAIAVLGAAIVEVSSNQRHIGLVYRDDDGQLRISHLQWHFRFEDRPLRSDDSFRFLISGLPDVSQHLLAAQAATIRDKSPRIPYSVVSRTCRFDEDGTYYPGDPGNGLTCATYVLAVAASMKFDLLDRDSWPSRADDQVWQQGVIDSLESRRASQEHIDGMRRCLPAARFRPEEVAAGVATASPPLAFPNADQLAREILQKLAN